MNDAPNARGFLARGGAWVVVQSILMAAVIVLGVIFRGDWSRVSLVVAGAGMFIAGGCIGIAGVTVLGRNRTPYPQPREGSKLIMHGIFARLRHPLYASVMLASVGWALIWQSGAAFIAALVLIPFFYAKANCEERWLRKQFPDYAGYERRVPRFIPRLFHPSRPV